MGAIPDTFEMQASKSNYTKLTPGKHRLRVLGPAISGWEWWTDTADGGRTPRRLPEDKNPPVEYAESVKKFLAFPVWNYTESRIQILSISQASIQKELKAYDKDPDWGDLQDYDIEITREGQDKTSTKYRVTAKPKSKIADEIIKAMTERGLPVLEALYKNADPFNYNPNAEYSLEEVKVEEDEFDKFTNK